jgi:hypothetical protein
LSDCKLRSAEALALSLPPNDPSLRSAIASFLLVIASFRFVAAS